MNESPVKLGNYRHFKGALCRVTGVAKHSETQEELVIYEHDGQMWARPLAMFLEEVERDGKRQPRFAYLGKEKLVRDNIPNIIRSEGKTPNVRMADVTEFRQALKQKLAEEVAEFAAGENAEELADILEVVAATSEAFGIDGQEIERVMGEKRAKRGGFEKRLILKQE